MSDQTKPLDIFRAGTHTAMSGVTLAFSESDLDAMIAAYDPGRHQAPLVVGHPKDSAPAYGWVRGLIRSGDVLQAQSEQVDPAFAELVNAGRYKKISASFYHPESPANPAPGVYYLRHVGFLGAQPPAVKGLRDASFADAEDGILTLEFGDWKDRENAGLWRRMREFFISQFGLEQANEVIPSYAVEELEAAAREPTPETDATLSPAYTETAMPDPTTPNPEDLAAREAALAARQAQIDAREARLAAMEAQARRQAHDDYAETLIQEGRLLPKDKAGLLAFMDALPETELEFGEGDGAFKGLSEAWLKRFLSALPVQVDFSERAGVEHGMPPAAKPPLNTADIYAARSLK